MCQAFMPSRLKSRKPAAVKFRKWVTSEVLPTLRTTGSYSIVPQQPALAMPTHPEALRLWVDQIEEAEKQKALAMAVARRSGEQTLGTQTLAGFV